MRCRWWLTGTRARASNLPRRPRLFEYERFYLVDAIKPLSRGTDPGLLNNSVNRYSLLNEHDAAKLKAEC